MEDGGFELARYRIACCAADATPVVTRITGVFGDVPTQDRWVTVTGVFQPGGDQSPGSRRPAFSRYLPPNDPYE